jgi:protease II
MWEALQGEFVGAFLWLVAGTSHIVAGRLLAGEHSFFDMAGPEVSPDEQLLAYGVDNTGSEQYTL